MEHPSTQGMYKGSNNQAQKLQESKKSRKDKKDWFRKEIKFWQDCWCGDSPLAIRFPKLFRFCRDKEASVAELMKFSNGVLFWDVTCEFL